MTNPKEVFAEVGPPQVIPPEVDSGLKAAKDVGVPLLFLAFLVYALWQIGRWSAPRFDEVFKALLASHGRVPQLIEDNAKQSAAVLASLNTQNALLEQFCERLDESNKRIEHLTETLQTKPR